MAALTEDQRREMRAKTIDAALALLDDLEHAREILAKPEIKPGDVRRLSVTLRRLAVDRDLSLVAAPRTGRIKLLSPDNEEIHRYARTRKVPFFVSGGGKIFGAEIRAIT